MEYKGNTNGQHHQPKHRTSHYFIPQYFVLQKGKGVNHSQITIHTDTGLEQVSRDGHETYEEFADADKHWKVLPN